MLIEKNITLFKQSQYKVTADVRSALMARLRTAPVDLTRVYAHPRLYDIDALLQVLPPSSSSLINHSSIIVVARRTGGR